MARDHEHLQAEGMLKPWIHVGQAAAALAGGIGVGRFVYTPILPLMHSQAGLSASAGANLATANYVGYLIGALAGTFAPRLLRSTAVLRISLLLMTATLAAMTATHYVELWILLRLLAGGASALVFVIVVNSLHAHLRDQSAHLAGWAFGGVGVGIAASGLLVLAIRSAATWQTAWLSSAGLGVVFAAMAWKLRPEQAAGRPVRQPGQPRTHRWFSALFVSYGLEGVGYIVAGTFLVAAIEQSSPGWIGSGAWVLVGLAVIPSSAVWAWLGHRFARPDLLFMALVVQAAGIALPALFAGVAPALISAFVFGATFLGIGTIALAAGDHLQFPRSVALLTAGYSVGQILGPLVVTPLLRHGYHQALLLAAAVVVAAAAAAAVLRIGFPRQLPAAEPVALSGIGPAESR